ncbi:MAG: hypothetical protein Kow0027_23740 [Saprospiraceae bacterium]
MNRFLTLVIALFLSNISFGQTLGIAPASPQRIIGQAAAQEESDFRNQLKAQGIVLELNAQRSEECTPDFLGNLVHAGESLDILLDTFDLSSDTSTPVLTILPVPAPKYGTVSLDEITLSYTASASFTGAALDTILVEYSQQTDKDTILVEVQVVRAGRTVVADGMVIGPEDFQSYCLDDELDFPSAKYCSEFLPSANSYDGRGRQNFYFTSYHYPDTCMVYWSSRFPGNDTVSVRICDELAVCDTFLIPVTITGDTIPGLPFFDDFSKNSGPWPAEQRWLDKDVFVNNTLAPNRPSIGMATFDGLDRRGRTLDIFEGKGDQLTSKAIDLSGYSPNQGVFLKFYLAPKGYGLEPEKVDSFTVEFRNKDREWVRAGTILGMEDVPLDSFPPFLFYSLPVDQSEFFHSAFQFRFTNYVSPGGFGDLWHLDYVRLAAGEGSSNDFEDLAFTQPPSNVLRQNTAMPWWHFSGFEAQELTDTLYSHFFNHFPDERAITNSAVDFRELTTGTDFNQGFTVTEMNEENKMPPKVHQVRQRVIPSSKFADLIQSLQAIPGGAPRVLETSYVFSQTSQTGGFMVNDTVRLHTVFDNYFAHDDGTAEWQIFVKFASGSGEQLATKYTANVEDTLRAVQFMFPHVNGDIESQVFNLKVWVGSLDSEPVYQRDLVKPFYPDNVWDTLQGFTTYRLEDVLGNETPVLIPAGDFYVGWQQVTPGEFGVPVGFDLQNPCNCNYSNLSGQWVAFPESIAGSLMIRPVFGDEAPANTTAPANETVRSAASILELYPNPASSILNLKLKPGAEAPDQLAIINTLGQVVLQSTFSESLDLSGIADGVYYLQLRKENSKELYLQKFIVHKP